MVSVKTSAQLLVKCAFLKIHLRALVEENTWIEYEEYTNPWHAASSSFIACPRCLPMLSQLSS